MGNEFEERNSVTLRQKGNEIQGYEIYEKNDFIVDEDIIGLDANVIVDIAESTEFKEEIKTYIQFNVLKICTTNIALGEARHVLIKKRNYFAENATAKINQIIKEFNIKVIKHKPEINQEAEKWVDIVKQKMFTQKFHTFPNDLRILCNLVHQEKVNFYITEDVDIEKAVKILSLPLRVKIIGEASNISDRKITEFFKENRKAHHKKRKPF